jgi:hypothetical protein
MPLEHERAFSANSPVGRYWLRNCVGFYVEGLRGPAGIVQEVGLGPDGVDLLAVRRRGIALRRIVLVSTHRVESIHPWDETIVLASRHRHARDRRVAQTKQVTRQAQTLAGAAAVETSRAVRDGVTVVLRLLGAFGTLLLGLGVVLRQNAPHARRHASRAASAVTLLARAYAAEGKRAWHTQREATAAWRQSRRERREEPGDDGPLTRAGADDEAADARRREAARR